MTVPEYIPIAPSYTRFSLPEHGAEGCVKASMGAKEGDITLVIDEDAATLTWGKLAECRDELLRIFQWEPVTDTEVAETFAWCVYGKVETHPRLENLLLKVVGLPEEKPRHPTIFTLH